MALLLCQPLAAQRKAFPDLLKAQYAGNIGQFGAGIAYQTPNRKFEGDLLLGYLPEAYSHRSLWTLALKGHYYPIHIRLSEHYNWSPLGPGVMATYTFGDEFFLSNPRDQYPKGYYPFSTAMQFYLLGSGYLERSIRDHTFIKRIGITYEWNINGKEFFSLVQNSEALSPSDVISMAIGLRLTL